MNEPMTPARARELLAGVQSSLPWIDYKYGITHSDGDTGYVVSWDYAASSIDNGEAESRFREIVFAAPQLAAAYVAAAERADALAALLRSVLDYEAEGAKLRGLVGCTCIARSEVAEQQYEVGKCPHQLASAAIAAGGKRV